jgi:hypothetical protein
MWLLWLYNWLLWLYKLSIITSHRSSLSNVGKLFFCQCFYSCNMWSTINFIFVQQIPVHQLMRSRNKVQWNCFSKLISDGTRLFFFSSFDVFIFHLILVIIRVTTFLITNCASSTYQLQKQCYKWNWYLKLIRDIAISNFFFHFMVVSDVLWAWRLKPESLSYLYVKYRKMAIPFV